MAGPRAGSFQVRAGGWGGIASREGQGSEMYAGAFLAERPAALTRG